MNSGSGKMEATTNDSLAWFRERFKDRLISRKCDIEWAVHSPDLNPPYFYLWGYLKDNVYENNPQTIGELKAAITAKIREFHYISKYCEKKLVLQIKYPTLCIISLYIMYVTTFYIKNIFHFPKKNNFMLVTTRTERY